MGVPMKVHVRFFAYLAETVGRKEKFEIGIEEGSTVTHLVKLLTHDSRVKKGMLDENNALKPDVTILKNGREIKFLSGMETLLEPGDEISIFPPVVGG